MREEGRGNDKRAGKLKVPRTRGRVCVCIYIYMMWQVSGADCVCVCVMVLTAASAAHKGGKRTYKQSDTHTQHQTHTHTHHTYILVLDGENDIAPGIVLEEHLIVHLPRKLTQLHLRGGGLLPFGIQGREGLVLERQLLLKGSGEVVGGGGGGGRHGCWVVVVVVVVVVCVCVVVVCVCMCLSKRWGGWLEKEEGRMSQSLVKEEGK